MRLNHGKALGAVLGFGVLVSATNVPPPADRLLARSMSPLVLGGSTALTIEADWVAGCRPHPETLDAVLELARRVRGGAVSAVAGNEIPRSDWDSRDASVRALVEANASVTGPGLAHVYLLWVPTVPMKGRVFGVTRWQSVSNGDRRASLGVVLVSADVVREQTIPGLGAAEIERATALHELGHVFGLVGDRAHAQKGDPYHCRRGRCLMPGPTRKMMARGAFRALFRGKLPPDFCEDCWSDLRRARAYYANPANEADLRQRSEWQEHLLSARYQAARGAWEEAGAGFREALARSVSAREYEDVAIAALEHGFAEAAWSAAGKAREKGLRSLILDRVRERAAVAAGHFTEAANAEDLFVRVEALEGMGRFDLAARTAQTGTSVAHRVVEAGALRRSGQPLPALAALRSLSSENGADPEVLLEKGRCFRALGREGDARESFRAAAEEAGRRAGRSSYTPSARRWRTAALSFALGGKVAEADAAMDRLLDHAWPEIALTTRAQVEAIRGETEASLRTLDRMRREGYRPVVDPCLEEDFARIPEACSRL